MPKKSKSQKIELVTRKNEVTSCRICNTEDESTVVNDIHQCTEFIFAIAQIRVNTGPHFPRLVCNQCINRLLDAYMLREMCIESEERLLVLIEDEQDMDTVDIFEPGEIMSKSDEGLEVNENEPEELEDVKLEEDEFEGGDNDVIEAEDTFDEVDEKDYTGNEYMDIETLDEAPIYLDEDEEETQDVPNDSQEDNSEGVKPTSELPPPESLKLPPTDTKRNKIVILEPVIREEPQKRKKVPDSDRPRKRVRSPLRPGETRTQRRTRKAKERRQTLIESGAKKYIKYCCQCDFSDYKKSEVKKHFQDHHVKMRPVERPNVDTVCDLCWVVFDTMDDLLNHLKNPEMKLFYCENCTFAGLTLDLLRRHNKKVHGIEEIYRCDLCPREFSHISSLKGHKDSVHFGITYVCDICGRSFKNQENLKGHKNVHDGVFPFACHVCDFRTARKSNLDAHMRSHSGAKPYKCPYCEKSFSFVTDRKRHIPVHTGVYPYTCEICEKGFIRKKLLVYHMQTTH